MPLVRVCSLWGTVCHHVELGVSRFIPSTPYPLKLGRTGVEQVIEITLTAEENAAFQKSAAAVRELVEKLKL